MVEFLAPKFDNIDFEIGNIDSISDATLLAFHQFNFKSYILQIKCINCMCPKLTVMVRHIN